MNFDFSPDILDYLMMLNFEELEAQFSVASETSQRLRSQLIESEQQVRFDKNNIFMGFLIGESTATATYY